MLKGMFKNEIKAKNYHSQSESAGHLLLYLSKCKSVSINFTGIYS